MQKSDSIVIIPTYNERENIENIIRAVFALEKVFHILIIEDGSPDGTANIVKTLQQEFPERLFMIERKGKLGLGTAYIAGFKWSLEHNYEYIFEMDADFSHNPADLPRLYKACAEEGADVSIGSRYVSGVNVVNWPMGRVLMSYFASKYVRLIPGLPIAFQQRQHQECTDGTLPYGNAAVLMPAFCKPAVPVLYPDSEITDLISGPEIFSAVPSKLFRKLGGFEIGKTCRSQIAGLQISVLSRIIITGCHSNRQHGFLQPAVQYPESHCLRFLITGMKRLT